MSGELTREGKERALARLAEKGRAIGGQLFAVTITLQAFLDDLVGAETAVAAGLVKAGDGYVKGNGTGVVGQFEPFLLDIGSRAS